MSGLLSINKCLALPVKNYGKKVTKVFGLVQFSLNVLLFVIYFAEHYLEKQIFAHDLSQSLPNFKDKFLFMTCPNLLQTLKTNFCSRLAPISSKL